MKNTLISLALVSGLTMSPAIALGQTAIPINIEGVGSDGSTYRLEFVGRYPQQNGWTIFDFYKRFPDGSETQINATTPWCFRNKVTRHPRALQPQMVPSPGWLAVGETGLTVVLANDIAKQNLLKSICSLQG